MLRHGMVKQVEDMLLPLRCGICDRNHGAGSLLQSNCESLSVVWLQHVLATV
jgi:hypothetical protein